MTEHANREDSVYQLLKAQVLGCVLRPGTVLGAEGLAKHRQASPDAVKQALDALCDEGLVVEVAQLGYLVTPVSPSDARELFELRRNLEVPAAAQAAQRASALEIAELREIYARGQERLAQAAPADPGHLEALISANRDFHVALAALSGNRRLAPIVARLLDEGRRLYFLCFHGERSANGGDPHADLLEALEARNADAARAAMAAHLDETETATLSAAKQAPG